MYLSGFDSLISVLIGMRGPLDHPGKGKWYGTLYSVFVAYLELNLFVAWITILVRFLTPGVPVEERCFTGFPTGTMTLSIIRRIDMYSKKSKYKKLMEEYLSLYGDSPQLNADVKRYSRIIRNIPRILFLFTVMPMLLINLIPILVALRGGPRILCVPAVYPFDTTENLFVFCYLCCLDGTAAFVSTLRSLMFENTFNMFVCRHLALTRHLSRELIRILSIARVDYDGEVTFRSDDGKPISKEQARRKVISELKQWVKNHQQSTRFHDYRLYFIRA